MREHGYDQAMTGSPGGKLLFELLRAPITGTLGQRLRAIAGRS